MTPQLSAEGFLEKRQSELTELLQAIADRMGLTDDAIRKFVAAAVFVPLDDSGLLFVRSGEDDLVYFVVRGAVRVTLSPEKDSLILSITPPGQFVLTGSYFHGSRRHHRFCAEAHIRSSVAVWSETIIAEVLALLPDTHKIRLMRCPWVGFSSQLELAHTLRVLPLRDQLLKVFRGLVRNFGVRQPNGWLIQLPIGITDLARLTGRARGNVLHRLKDLLENGLVQRVARKHWVVSEEVMRPRAR